MDSKSVAALRTNTILKCLENFERHFNEKKCTTLKSLLPGQRACPDQSFDSGFIESNNMMRSEILSNATDRTDKGNSFEVSRRIDESFVYTEEFGNIIQGHLKQAFECLRQAKVPVESCENFSKDLDVVVEFLKDLNEFECQVPYLHIVEEFLRGILEETIGKDEDEPFWFAMHQFSRLGTAKPLGPLAITVLLEKVETFVGHVMQRQREASLTFQHERDARRALEMLSAVCILKGGRQGQGAMYLEDESKAARLLAKLLRADDHFVFALLAAKAAA